MKLEGVVFSVLFLFFTFLSETLVVLPASQVMRNLFGDELGAGILGFVHHMEEVRDAFSGLREAWEEAGAEWEHMHDRPGEIIKVELQQCVVSFCLKTALSMLREESLEC